MSLGFDDGKNTGGGGHVYDDDDDDDDGDVILSWLGWYSQECR